MAVRLIHRPALSQDVDLVILDNKAQNTEALKEILRSDDSNFYFVAARDPNATYRVLWYKLASGRRCKVDILTTGASTSLNIPRVPDVHVQFRSGIVGNDLPVMPLLALVLLKLQGWSDHRHSTKGFEQQKVRADRVDIEEMLKIARNADVKVGDPESEWMAMWFGTQMKKRVDEYVKKFPESFAQWVALGLT